MPARGPGQVYTYRQICALLDESHDCFETLWLATLVLTGAKRSEFLRMKESDIRNDGLRLGTRIVDVPPVLCDVLSRYRGNTALFSNRLRVVDAPRHGTMLWIDVRTQEPLTDHKMVHVFNRIGRRVGFSISAQNLRLTRLAVEWARLNGRSLDRLRYLAGVETSDDLVRRLKAAAGRLRPPGALGFPEDWQAALMRKGLSKYPLACDAQPGDRFAV